MACPRCGQLEREPIAPGFWRCTSWVTVTDFVMLPTPGTPPHLGIMSPQPVQNSVRCNTEYQEMSGGPAATPPCGICGTFSIALCRDCGVPVCGAHSELREDRRLCARDVAAFDERAAAQRAAEVEAQGRAEAEAQLAPVLAALSAADDPFERLLIFASPLCSGAFQLRIDRGRQLNGYTRELPETRPEVVTWLRNAMQPCERPCGLIMDGHPGAWRFDPIGLMRWVSEVRRVPPSAQVRRVTTKRGITGRPRFVKGRTEPGWLVGTGTADDGGYRVVISWEYQDLALSDGNVARAQLKNRRVQSASPLRRINWTDLVGLARTCGVIPGTLEPPR